MFCKEYKLIVEKENNKERLDKIWEITTYLFGGILGEEGQEEISKIINEKVGEKDMESLVLRIRAEEKRQRRELERKAEKRGQTKGEKIGKEKAKQEIINKIKTKILNSNEDEKFIQKVNNLLNSI